MNNKLTIIKKMSPLLIPFVLIGIMNHLTLFTSDDYMYQFFYEQGAVNTHSHKLVSLMEIVPSMYNHYLFQNGRIIAHTLVQFFAYWDTKIVFNLFNSLAFVSLGVLILLIANKKGNRVLTGIATYFLLWFSLPQFGLTVLWLSGAGNYLWMSMLMLLFLLPYRYGNNVLTKKYSVLIYPYMLLTGFFSGWSNENSGPAALCIALLFVFYDYINNKKLRIWKWVGLGGNLVGFLIMMSSPASLKRGEMSYSLEQLFQNFVGVFKMAYAHFYWLLILILILYSINSFFRYFTEELFFYSSFFFLGSFLGTFALVFSPDYPLRTLFGPTVFTIIGIVMLVNQLILVLPERLKQLSLILIVFSSIHFSETYLTAVLDLSITHAEVSTQIKLIQKYRGLEIIEVKKITPTFNRYNAFSESRNLSNDESDWFNQWMAEYYEVNKIRGYD